MLASVTHILPLTAIRRLRVLPVNGRVLVRTGQKVLATEVIADAQLVRDHLVLEVSRGLGLSPDNALKAITRKIGEQVEEGDIIAGPVGFFSRVIRAPKAGMVSAIWNGQVLLEVPTRPFELQAGITGVITELVPDRGAVIETTGALIQGVWGNGKIDAGLLNVVCRGPEDELLTSHLDVSARGSVVVGGICTQPEVIKMASEIPLKGLILASLMPNLLPLACQVSSPIMVLEGFGKLGMDSVAFRVLSTNDRREVCVNAAPFDRFAGTRPEVVIPLPASGQVNPPREVDVFAPGQIARITHPPFKGKIVTIVSLRPGLTSFTNGIRAPAAMVRQESGEQSNVPLANLELIE